MGIVFVLVIMVSGFLESGQLSVSALFVDDFSVIDLTHELNSNAIYWPGNPSFLFTILNRGPTPAGYWYESNKFETPEHGGTHLDAPAHFAEGNWRVHEVPAQRLVGPGVVIDVTRSASLNPDYRLDVSDLLSWEKKHKTIPDGAVVLMSSGWAVRYPNKTLTFNTENVSNPATFHFPGFHPDAIDWLIKNRNISMIGVDTPSVDFGQSTTFEVHQKVARANILGLENVSNLDKIPPAGSLIFVGVVKLFDGSGGPVRILAVLGLEKPELSCSAFEHNTGRATTHLGQPIMICFVMILISQFVNNLAK